MVLTQVVFLHLNQIRFRKRQEYFLHYRFLGYWIAVPVKSIPSGFPINEIPEWNPRNPKKYLNKKLFLCYEGNYYKKLAFKENFNLIDRIILV